MEYNVSGWLVGSRRLGRVQGSVGSEPQGVRSGEYEVESGGEVLVVGEGGAYWTGQNGSIFAWRGRNVGF
jgi:hypothetical protein